MKRNLLEESNLRRAYALEVLALLGIIQKMNELDLFNSLLLHWLLTK